MASSSVLARGASAWLFLRAPRMRACFTVSHTRAFSLVDRVPGAPQEEAAPVVEKVSVQWTVGDEQSTSKKCDPYEQGGKHLLREQAEENRTQVPSARGTGQLLEGLDQASSRSPRPESRCLKRGGGACRCRTGSSTMLPGRSRASAAQPHTLSLSLYYLVSNFVRPGSFPLRSLRVRNTMWVMQSHRTRLGQTQRTIFDPNPNPNPHPDHTLTA